MGRKHDKHSQADIHVQWSFADGKAGRLNPFAESALMSVDAVEADLKSHEEKSGHRPIKLRVKRQRQTKAKRGEEPKPAEAELSGIQAAIAAVKKMVQNAMHINSIQDVQEALQHNAMVRKNLDSLLGEGSADLSADALRKAVEEAQKLLHEEQELVRGIEGVKHDCEKLFDAANPAEISSYGSHLSEAKSLAQKTEEDAKAAEAQAQKLYDELREQQGYIEGLVARVSWMWADSSATITPFQVSSFKSGTETHAELEQHKAKGRDRPVRLKVSSGSGKKHKEQEIQADSISSAMDILRKLIESETHKGSVDEVRRQLKEHEEMVRKIREAVEKAAEKPTEDAGEVAGSGSKVVEDAQKIYDTAQQTLDQAKALLDGASDEDMARFGEQLRKSVAESQQAVDDAKEALDAITKLNKDWGHSSGIIGKVIGKFFN